MKRRTYENAAARLIAALRTDARRLPIKNIAPTRCRRVSRFQVLPASCQDLAPEGDESHFPNRRCLDARNVEALADISIEFLLSLVAPFGERIERICEVVVERGKTRHVIPREDF